MGSAKQPKYVRLEGTVLRYRSEENDYYCDNGDWSVNYRQRTLTDPHSFMPVHFCVSVSNRSVLHDKRLFGCTEAEWVESIGHYMPHGYQLEESSHDKWFAEQMDGCFADALKDSNKEKYKYLLIRG